jgi:hypothetical protein
MAAIGERGVPDWDWLEGLAGAVPARPDLYDPASFEGWWTAELRAGRGRGVLIAELEADGRPIAFARASMLAQGAGDFERWRAYVGRALETDEPAVETFAMARLGLLEVMEGAYRQGDRPARDSDGIPVLRQVIRSLRRALPTPLVQEAEARTRYALAAACIRAVDHVQAAEEAGRAVDLAAALGLEQLRHSAQLVLGQALMGQGEWDPALRLLEALAQPGVDPNVLVFARINQAIMRFHRVRTGRPSSSSPSPGTAPGPRRRSSWRAGARACSRRWASSNRRDAGPPSSTLSTA